MAQILPVRCEADAAEVRILVGEFVEWLAERYPDTVCRALHPCPENLCSVTIKDFQQNRPETEL